MPNLPAPSDPNRIVADPDRAPVLFDAIVNDEEVPRAVCTPTGPLEKLRQFSCLPVFSGVRSRYIAIARRYITRFLRGRHHGTPVARGR